MIDHFCIRHGLDSSAVIETWELSRVLQVLHADAVSRGASLRWAAWLDPDPAHLAAFDAASQASSVDWDELEPSFAS